MGWNDPIFGAFTFGTALICKNGHLITDSLEDEPFAQQNFCSICGAEIISACSECGTKFIGAKRYEQNAFTTPGPRKVPAYCRQCGKPYPWTQAALDAATALIREEDELSEAQREQLVTSLPDIVTETPKTSVAIVRFKKGLSAVGKFTAEGLRQFAIDLGCELARKQLGL